LKPLSKDLSALGNAGLALLDYLEKGTALPQGFTATWDQEMRRFARPMVEVTMAAARPVKILLETAKK